MKKILVLINKISANPTADEIDVLEQANEIRTALETLGYSASNLFMGLNLEETADELLNENPDLVFNLVEGLNSTARLIHLSPALLESLNIPYTGCRLDSMFLTSNKILTKKILALNLIRTPTFYAGSEKSVLDPQKIYIAKPLWEDASVGITDRSVFPGKDSGILEDFRSNWGDSFFIEEFIEGREFNVSILGGQNGPEIMPLAEILFKDFPEDKPRIVGYAAKWDSDTFEYKNTVRTFEYNPADDSLRSMISTTALKCWDTLGLRGYARVDFRVDKNNLPYVLEINANPCVSRDAGFFAACEKAGMTYEQMVQRIIYEAY